MKLKMAAGVMVILMLMSMLTIAFNVPQILADAGTTEHPNYNPTIQKTDGDKPSNLTDSHESFATEGLNRNASAKENLKLYSVDEDRWNFNSTNEWTDFAKVDCDSAELIVGVNSGNPNNYANIIGLIDESGGDSAGTVSMDGKIRAVVADIPLGAISSFVTEVRDADLSTYIEPNMKFQACFVPDDPYWSYQWGPRIIEADYAWNTTLGDTSVLVAVIDTGIDWNHPDLAANYVALGYDWVNDDTDPMDDEGHGTHCAGIIAAVINNGIGVAGLAQVKIMAEKGLDSWGYGYENDLANAIIHAVDQGADILSNSWGSYGESALIYEAVEYAYDHGVLVAAAAGNDAASTEFFPAAFDEVIAVTATDEYDNPAWFLGWWGTNFGDWVELAAPGVDIYSTVWDDSYAYMSGTSMAAPHVVGVAALILSQFPSMTRDQVRLQLRFTADDLGDSGFDDYYGYGRINARRAVEQAPPDHDLLILDWERPRFVEPGGLAVVNTTVFNFGTSNETDITVQLLVNGSIVDSATIGFLETAASETVNCSWTPAVEGTYNLTSYVVPVQNETLTANNFVTAMVDVGYFNYILFDQTHWTDSIVMYSTWVNTLSERGYVVDVHTSGPITPTVLADYVALVIPQAWDPYSLEELSAIQSFVVAGGGLLVIGDDEPSVYTDLTAFAGISWVSGGYSGITTDVTPHEVTLGVTSVYLDAPIAEMVVGGCAQDLVRDPWGGIMLAVSEQPGRVIGFADEGSLWDYGITQEDNLLLANNMVDWLVFQPEHDLAVILGTPPYVAPGGSSLLNVTVRNRGLSNETDVELFLFINGTIVKNETAPEIVSDSSYTMDYLWTPAGENVMYNVTGYAVPVENETATMNNLEWAYVYIGVPVKAFVLDSAGTDNSGIISTWQLLTTSWYVFGEKMTFIDYTTLNNEDLTYEDLAATDADVLIISCASDPYQGWEFTDSEIEAIGRYVQEGHGLIATSGTFYGMVPNNNKLAPLFGLTETITWHQSYTDLLHIEDPTHPLFDNVPNPYTFPGTYSAFPSDGQWDSNELAGGEYVALGHFQESAIVVCRGLVYISPLLEYGIPPYYHHHLQLLYNAITWSSYQKPEHELVVSLDAPAFIEPGDSSLLNATVHNRGLSNETNVELFLLINGTIVNSTIISKLLTGASYTISYWWTPTIEGTYNATAFAPPVSGEEFTANNQKSKFVEVFEMLIAVVLDSYGTDQFWDTFWNYLNTNWATYGSTRILIDYTALNKENITLADIEATNADVLIISDAWSDTHAYGWEFSDSEIEAIKTYVLSGHGIIATSGTFDTWSAPNNQKLAELFGMDPTVWYNWGFNGDQKETTGIFDLQVPRHDELWRNIADPYLSGSLITLNPTPSLDWTMQGVTTGWIEALSTDHYAAVITSATIIHKAVYFTCMVESMGQYNENNRQLFYNAIVWTQLPPHEHELAVSLEAPSFLEPGASSLLNATVYNIGLSNETDVELFLLINGTAVNSTAIPELLTGQSYTINYLWTPAVEATYNVTAYAPPVPGENVTVNNVVSKIIHVRYVYVALISDYAELLAITPILDSLGIGYDIYNDNRLHLYTEHLNLLLSYPTVIFYTDYRQITLDEYSALESYLSSGGNLLVTGFDSLVSDDLLRDIIRSATMGDNVGEPDLYVVDETHSIMNGPYGSFPAGYHISGLSSDCDAVEADTARMAVTVAELWDGYDKIIATDGLPGKVVYWNGVGPEDWMWNVDCEVIFKNTLTWFLIRYEHELAVRLDAPTFLEPGESSLLNATVYNRGSSNETSVELQLLINDTVVDSAVISELLAGSSYTLSHLWTPTVEGIYNLTAYAPPVPGENFTVNNMVSRFVNVQYLEVALFKNVDPWDYPANEEAFSLYGIAYAVFNSKDFGLVDLGSFSKVVIASDQDQAFYDAMDAYGWWFEDYVSSGGLLEIHAADFGWHGGQWIGNLPGGLGWVHSDSDYVTIVDPMHHVVTTPNPITDSELDGWSSSVHGYFSIYPTYSHIVIAEDSTGHPAYLEFNYGGGAIVASSQTLEWAYSHGYSLILENSLLYFPSLITYPHELAVFLNAPTFLEPSDSSLLNATVYNRGLNNETDVELFLLINGTEVESVVIPELLNGSSYTLSYLWIPTVEGIYNITAYAPPVPGENVTANNMISVAVLVQVMPTIRVSPSYIEVPQNTLFNVTILIENMPEDPGVAGVEFKLTWNSSVLEGVSMVLPPGHFMEPDGDDENLWILKNEIDNTFNSTHGRAWYAITFVDLKRAIEMGYAPKSGSGTLAVITFNSTALGETDLHFTVTKVANPQAELIPTKSIDGTVCVCVSALRGDINGDGIVDIYDVIILGGAFGSEPGDPRWNPDADLNSDGIIDIYDAIILAGNFQKTI